MQKLTFLLLICFSIALAVPSHLQGREFVITETIEPNVLTEVTNNSVDDRTTVGIENNAILTTPKFGMTNVVGLSSKEEPVEVSTVQSILESQEIYSKSTDDSTTLEDNPASVTESTQIEDSESTHQESSATSPSSERTSKVFDTETTSTELEVQDETTNAVTVDESEEIQSDGSSELQNDLAHEELTSPFTDSTLSLESTAQYSSAGIQDGHDATTQMKNDEATLQISTTQDTSEISDIPMEVSSLEFIANGDFGVNTTQGSVEQHMIETTVSQRRTSAEVEIATVMPVNISTEGTIDVTPVTESSESGIQDDTSKKMDEEVFRTIVSELASNPAEIQDQMVGDEDSHNNSAGYMTDEGGETSPKSYLGNQEGNTDLASSNIIDTESSFIGSTAEPCKESEELESEESTDQSDHTGATNKELEVSATEGVQTGPEYGADGNAVTSDFQADKITDSKDLVDQVTLATEVSQIEDDTGTSGSPLIENVSESSEFLAENSEDNSYTYSQASKTTEMFPEDSIITVVTSQLDSDNSMTRNEQEASQDNFLEVAVESTTETVSKESTLQSEIPTDVSKISTTEASGAEVTKKNSELGDKTSDVTANYMEGGNPVVEERGIPLKLDLMKSNETTESEPESFTEPTLPVTVTEEEQQVEEGKDEQKGSEDMGKIYVEYTQLTSVPEFEAIKTEPEMPNSTESSSQEMVSRHPDESTFQPVDVTVKYPSEEVEMTEEAAKGAEEEIQERSAEDLVPLEEEANTSKAIETTIEMPFIELGKRGETLTSFPEGGGEEEEEEEKEINTNLTAMSSSMTESFDPDSTSATVEAKGELRNLDVEESNTTSTTIVAPVVIPADTSITESLGSSNVQSVLTPAVQVDTGSIFIRSFSDSSIHRLSFSLVTNVVLSLVLLRL